MGVDKVMEVSRPACCSLAGLRFGLLLAHGLEIERYGSADEILQRRLITLSPSWMSMARLTFPLRLELKRPEGPPTQLPWQMSSSRRSCTSLPCRRRRRGRRRESPIHFHSSTISGSVLWMTSRTFASVFPRESPSSLIFASMNAEADSTQPQLYRRLASGGGSPAVRVHKRRHRNADEGIGARTGAAQDTRQRHRARVIQKLKAT